MLDIRKQIEETLAELGLPRVDFVVELTKDLAHGDYASNVALVTAKISGRSPKEIAEQIKEALPPDPTGYIEKVEVAGPGFLNFFVSEKYLVDVLNKILEKKDKFGRGHLLQDKKIMVEFCQANPFKQLHVGHFMGTVLGECYARLYETTGAGVLRANYQGDVGVHVACAVWGMKETKEILPSESATLQEKSEFLGKAYAFGARAYKENPETKSEIDELNKKIYQKSDPELNELYEMGKRWSLAHFDVIYKKLGTRFDYLFFESEMAPLGLEVIAQNRGVFEDSNGAVIFQGEKFGLHTRVFISSAGLPVYEAKELGLNKRKFDLVPLDLSVVDTSNEINDYFKVVMKVMELTIPEVAKRTRHVSHGMLRLPTGKMSSRTGNVITGESLISDVEKLVADKNPDPVIAQAVAIGAIKYEILKQAPGHDVIFNVEKSLSLEGDSGPYLQYSYARTQSLLRKGEEAGIVPEVGLEGPEIIRFLARFPEVLEKAASELAPQLVATYLIQLASLWNAYYANNQIVDITERPRSSKRLSLANATGHVLAAGLWTLGIPVLARM